MMAGVLHLKVEFDFRNSPEAFSSGSSRPQTLFQWVDTSLFPKDLEVVDSLDPQSQFLGREQKGALLNVPAVPLKSD